MENEGVQALRKGRAAWEAWREKQTGTIDLGGAELALDGNQGNWNLSRCNMKGCVVSGAGALQLDLRAADLTDGKFAGGTTIASLLLDQASRLDGTVFADVTLSGVDLSATALTGTSFFRSLLRSVKFGGELRNVDLGRSSLNDVDFSDATLIDCSLASTNATGCRFDGAKFRSSPPPANDPEHMGMTLEQALLRTCTFLDTQFDRCKLVRTVFVDCDLRRANGMVLDDTVLRDTLLSPDAEDDWSVLQRSYTGANMVFNLIALMIFFAPWIAQAIYWSGVNQLQLALIDGATKVEAEMAKRPTEGDRLAALSALLKTIDPQFKACVQPSAHADRPKHAACRPIWQVLIGVHEGALAVVLSLLLLAYNGARLVLTWKVAPMRDDEKRTWQSPARDSYRGLMSWHRAVRALMVVAILAAMVHLGPRLLAPVWVAGV